VTTRDRRTASAKVKIKKPAMTLPCAKANLRDARTSLRYIASKLQFDVERDAQFAIDRLTPHRAAIPGSTMDEALDRMKRILVTCARLQTDLRSTRRLLNRKSKTR